jgi:hypothetical protein
MSPVLLLLKRRMSILYSVIIPKTSDREFLSPCMLYVKNLRHSFIIDGLVFSFSLERMAQIDSPFCWEDNGIVLNFCQLSLVLLFTTIVDPQSQRGELLL